jgi:dolichol-phosphate mannosyltransferase
VLRFSRNFGHSAAVFAGLSRVSGDLVAIIDADLQDPPELLSPMIQTLDKTGADVVYGQRSERKGESFLKRVTAWMFYRFLNLLSGVEIPRDTGDFRVMTREVSDAVSSLTEREPFLRGLVAWVGFKQVAFPYERQRREHGTTKYPLRKMIHFASHAIISFSLLPLRLAVYAGLLGMSCSLCLSVYALYLHAQGNTVPGWASIIVGFTFGQSTTLLVIGIIGIYLGRVHSSLQLRPRYILRGDEKPAAHLSLSRDVK